MDTLIVFARAPQPGTAKTRLATVFGTGAAHRLYAAMFADTLDLAGRVQARRLLSLAGAAVPDLPPDWIVLRQPERSFGERLAWSFAQAFADGARRCVLIGADAPHLQPGWIDEAFAALASADVVVGPTHDGGYYLLGLREAAPWIFREVSWSTPAVCEQTLRLVREHGCGDRLSAARPLPATASEPAPRPHARYSEIQLLTAQLGAILAVLLTLQFLSGALFYLYVFYYDAPPWFTFTRFLH